MAIGPINQALQQVPASQRRFHVPGHSGTLLFDSMGLSREFLRYDLTELEGLDDLANPMGCIADSQAMTAKLFGVAESFYLLQGATLGLQAAMLAAFHPGDRVLLPRNVHRAILSGLILTGAQPIWMLPKWNPEFGVWGAVDTDQVEVAFQANPGVKGMVLSNPTYEGLASPIEALGALCQYYGKYLIVDEAHGALWPFNDALPQSAVQSANHAAASAVVQSLHKTGGSLTQTAVLHRPQGSLLESSSLRQALNTLQTTSPSYPLLASLEAACLWLGSEAGNTQLQQTLEGAQTLRRTVKKYSSVRCMDSNSQRIVDPMKLWVQKRNTLGNVLDGETWAEQLETEQGLAYETCSPYGVLYLAQLGLQSDDFEALAKGLKEKPPLGESDGHCLPKQPIHVLPDQVLSPREAFFAGSERILSAEALGRVAKEAIVRCPPGIPVLLPGERITEQHLPYLEATVPVIR